MTQTTHSTDFAVDLPPGWGMQGPMDGVTLIYSKLLFEFENDNRTQMRRATVRRTLSNGKVDEYTYRVNSKNDVLYQVAWLAPQDLGQIQLISVGDCPDEGGMDAFPQMSLGALNNSPVLFNNSPHWVYVAAIGEVPSSDRLIRIKRVLSPSGRMTIGNPGDRPKLEWFAAEPQRTDLYAPFP